MRHCATRKQVSKS